MHLWLDILVVWGVVSLPLGCVVGRYLARVGKVSTMLPTTISVPMPDGSMRLEQHRYDAAHNPNYRGGYKP